MSGDDDAMDKPKSGQSGGDAGVFNGRDELAGCRPIADHVRLLSFSKAVTMPL